MYRSSTHSPTASFSLCMFVAGQYTNVTTPLLSVPPSLRPLVVSTTWKLPMWEITFRSCGVDGGGGECPLIVFVRVVSLMESLLWWCCGCPAPVAGADVTNPNPVPMNPPQFGGNSTKVVALKRMDSNEWTRKKSKGGGEKVH